MAHLLKAASAVGRICVLEIEAEAPNSLQDATFGDSHTIWAQHSSGSFTQFDLRESTKPMDGINRVASTWNPNGSVTFITDNQERWEAPYDDV